MAMYTLGGEQAVTTAGHAAPPGDLLPQPRYSKLLPGFGPQLRLRTPEQGSPTPKPSLESSSPVPVSPGCSPGLQDWNGLGDHLAGGRPCCAGGLSRLHCFLFLLEAEACTSVQFSLFLSKVVSPGSACS